MSYLFSIVGELLPQLGVAIGGALAMLGVLWKARQSGKQAAQAEAMEDALEMQKDREEIRRELDAASEEELDRRADRWRVD